MVKRSKLRLAAILGGVLLIVAVIVLMALQSGPVRQYALRRAIEYLDTTQGIHLRVEDLRYSLLGGSATLRGVVIRSSAAPDMPPFVVAERAHVKVGLLSLLRGFLHIENAEFDHLTVRILFDEDGRNNLPAPTEQAVEEAEGGAPEFLVAHLRAPHISLWYEDRAQRISAQLPNARLEIEGRASDFLHTLRLATNDAGSTSYEGRRLTVGGLQLVAGVPGDITGFRLESLDIVLDGSQIAASGRLDDFTDPRLSFRVNARVDVGKLSRFAGIEEPLAGRVTADAEISGTPNALEVDADVEGDELAVRDFRQLGLRARVRWDQATNRVELSSMTLTSPHGGATGGANLALPKETGAAPETSSADLTVQRLDLASLLAAAGSEARLASRVSGEVDASWPGLDFAQADGRARLRLEATRASAARNLLPVSGTVSLKAKDRRVTVTDSSLSTPGARVNLDATVTGLDVAADNPDGRLSGEVQALVTDLNTLVANLSAFSGEPAPETDLAGSATINATLGGTVQKPLVSASLEAPALQVGQLKDIALNAAVQASTEQIRVERVTAEWQGQALTAWGRVGLTGESPSLDLQAQARRTTIQSLLAALEQKITASGTADLDARITGTVAAPEGEVNLRVTDLEAYSEPFGELTARAVLQNQVVRLEEFKLEKPEVPGAPGSQAGSDGAGAGAVTATGSYHLDTQAYDVRLSSQNLELAHLVLPGMEPISGKLALSAEGQGTVQDPALDMRLDAEELVMNEQQVGPVALTSQVRNQQAKFELQAPRFNTSARGDIGIEAPYNARVQADVNGLDLSKLPVKMAGLAGGGSESAGVTPAAPGARETRALPGVTSAAPGARETRALPGETRALTGETATQAGIGVEGLSGTLTAKIQAEGPLEDVKSGQASAEIELLSATIANQQIQNQGPIRLRYADRRLVAEESTIATGPSRFTFAGELPAERAGRPGRVTVDGSLDLKTLSAFLPADSGVNAQGKAELKGEIRGNLEKLEPDLNLTMADATVEASALNQPLQDVDLSARVAAGAVTIETLHARLGSGSIDASGEIPLGILPTKLPLGIEQDEGSARLTAKVSNLAVESFAAAPSDMTGVVSLTLETSAPRAELEAVSGQLRFDDLRLKVAGVDLAQQGTSQVTIQDGAARVDRFLVTGPETRIEASGTAGLAAPGRLDLRLSGTMDLALAAFFAEGIEAGGDSRFELTLSGTRQEPQANGFFQVDGGQVAMEQPAVQLTDLTLRLDLARNEITIARLNGNLNGGTLTGSGRVTYSPTGPAQVNVDLSADNVFMEAIEGLRTAANADVQVRSDARGLINVGGRVDVLQGSFTEDVNVGEELLGIFASEEELELIKERSPLLERVRFNVRVQTQEPVIVDNNLAQAAMNMNVRLAGTYYSPGLVGRVNLEEGGEIYLRERTYYLERGAISFNNERRIEPTLDVTATTQAKDAGTNLDITLRISGSPDDMETSLTSDPPLPEPDLIAILVTGRKLEEARGEASAVMREQTLSLLAGGVAGRIGSGLERATGLSTVRIEPNLIAAESDPSARLTVGQDITPQLELIYSMNLTDSSDQIYVAEYDLTRRFTTRLVHETDPKVADEEEDTGSLYRFEFRHDVHLGGGPNTGEPRSQQKREKREVRAVRISGGFAGIPQEKLADRFDVEAGDTYSFFAVNRGMDRLREYLIEQGRLEARVRLSRRDISGAVVELNLDLKAGPKVEFGFTGANVSDDIKEKVRKAWTEGIFDAQRAQGSIDLIRDSLLDDGYLEAKVDWRATPTNAEVKTVTFSIDPGVRYENVEIQFPGAKQIEADDLEEALEKAELLEEIRTDPDQVADFLRGYYRQNGYLQAEIEAPVYDLNPQTRSGRIQIPVSEGALSRLTELRFVGNSALTEAQLRQSIPLRLGEPYDPRLRDTSVSNIRIVYSERGYNDAVVDAEIDATPESGRMAITFRIQEGRQEVIREIYVSGLERTSHRFVLDLLELKQGDVHNPDKVGVARRNLYDTQAYTLVDIQTEELPETARQAPTEKPVRLDVRLREVKPYRIQYGGFYDTDRGPGAIMDITNRNSISSGAVLGLRTRYDREFRESRLYFGKPRMFGLPLDTNAVLFGTREVRPNLGFNVDRVGASLTQQYEFRNDFILTYGYRFERARTYETGPDPFFDVTLDVAPLTTSLTRDLRDDLLDASRGSFTSHSLEYARGFLGSDLLFMRYFGQYFQYIPLGAPTTVPWTGEERSRLVYAGGIRIGLARTFGGQELVRSERFFAGGGTSIRGFDQDTLGPRDEIGDPAGGNAVFILNNELRFPLIWIFDGVGFVDVGNIYPTVRDFDPFDIRKTAGFGLRLRTPYFLLRGDLGFKLDRREGEKRGAFFFSIGQAF